MRRSLAGHARERLERAESLDQFERAMATQRQAIAEQCARMGLPMQPNFVTPDVTALRLRTENAERNATFLYRTAIALVGVLVLVVGLA